MGYAPESMMVVYEAGKKNIFTKIGEMVIALYKKFVETIDNIIDKIKTNIFNKKSDLQKLDILMKKHPELKKEEEKTLQEALKDGIFDLRDIESLKKLDESFDEIL